MKSSDFFLFGKHMLADGEYHRTGKDPLAGAFGGVVEVNGAAGGIPAVESVLGRLAGAVGDGHPVKLSIGYRAECPRLKQYAGKALVVFDLFLVISEGF